VTVLKEEVVKESTFSVLSCHIFFSERLLAAVHNACFLIAFGPIYLV